MADDPQRRRVPARYVGHQAVKLRGDVRYFDGTGAKRAAGLLKPGETLMVPESELRGQTFLLDFTQEADPEVGITSTWLGAGTVLLPDHAAAGLKRDQLVGARFLKDGRVLGYEFHDGRSDFEPLDAAADAPKKGAKAAKATAADPVPAEAAAAPATDDTTISSETAAPEAPAEATPPAEQGA